MVYLRDLIGCSSEAPLGTFMKIPAVETVEIMKLAGFDFIVIDLEHAPLSLGDVNHMLVVARAIGLSPIVRVPDHGYADVQRVLDGGAAGIFIPHVSDATECRRVMDQALHPPLGSRGAGGGMRAADWGMNPQGRERYVPDGRDRVMRIVMIEEQRAVDSAEEIVGVPGVDGIFIGPSDLSMTMGMSPGDQEVREAVDRVFKVSKAAGIPVGTVAADGSGARALSEAGYDFVLVSSDTAMLGRAAREMVSASKR